MYSCLFLLGTTYCMWSFYENFVTSCKKMLQSPFHQRTITFKGDCRKSPNLPFSSILGVIKSSSYKAQNWFFRVFRQSQVNVGVLKNTGAITTPALTIYSG